MKTTTPKTSKNKPLAVKALPPKKDPKGGRKGGTCDDEFGCGTNHNECLVADAAA